MAGGFGRAGQLLAVYRAESRAGEALQAAGALGLVKCGGALGGDGRGRPLVPRPVARAIWGAVEDRGGLAGVLERADRRREGQCVADSDLDGVGAQSATGMGGAGVDNKCGFLACADVGLDPEPCVVAP